MMVLVSGFMVSCSQPLPDEQQIRQAISEMEKAAEAKESGPILAYLADDFIANKTYRKANIRGMLLLHYRQNQHVHVYLHIKDLHITDDRAKLTCQVILAGRGEKIVPERAKAMQIHSSWQKRDGKWRVVRAQWRDPLLQP